MAQFQKLKDPMEELLGKLEVKRLELAAKYPNGLIPDDGPSVCARCGGAGSLLERRGELYEEPKLVPCNGCTAGAEVQTRSYHKVLRNSGMEDHAKFTFDTTAPLPGQEQQHYAAFE